MAGFHVRITRSPQGTTFSVERLKGSAVDMLAVDAEPTVTVFLNAEDEGEAAQLAWQRSLEAAGKVLAAEYEAKKAELPGGGT